MCKPENALARDFDLFSLLRFAAPTIVTMLFMGLYTITDTIFVARFAGTDALSALNIVCPMINLIVGLGAMLSTGSSAVIARQMGAGAHTKARQNFTLIVLTGAALGVLVALLGTVFADRIIYALGASERLVPYCRAYLIPLLLFTPASMLQVLFQSLIVAAGRPGLGMALSTAAGVINIALDYCFMAPLGLGITGAALGTGAGYLVSAAAGLFFFLGSSGPLRFCRPKWDFRMLAQSCLNGSSELVSQLAAAVTTFLFNAAMMRLLGEAGVAAITILIYTQFLLTTFFIGFSMGVAPVVSYQYGMGDHTRLRRLFRVCLTVVSAASLLIFLLSFVFGAPLVGIFAPPGTAVYQIARHGFFIFPFSFLFCGINIFASAFFTALSNGKVSAGISFLRTFCLLPLGILTLPLFFQATGVWLAVPVAELTALFVSCLCLRRYRAVYHY